MEASARASVKENYCYESFCVSFRHVVDTLFKLYVPQLNPNSNSMKRNNQPLCGETSSVSYTVCVNHVVEKVVSSTGGTVVYNTNKSVGAVVGAVEIPWKLRNLPRK